MKIVTATATSEQIGPLTQRVYDFVEAQRKAMEAGVTKPSDWDGMLEYIDPEKFKRVGAYLALKKNGPGIAADYAFTPGERAALDAAYPGLTGHATQLADW